jgi:hypothetical protein
MAATAQDVCVFLGRGDDPATLALAQAHLPLVTEFVRAYTRGNGFTGDQPDASISAVIVTATARMVQNPELIRQATTGTESRSYTTFDGFSMIEQLVLNKYRLRAV